uniref:Uncharacterized protein n=1 Tax=Myotis myotis TaxID=51298 RepID=A0A7J7U5D6_MYOMY|nr:hypothetical protein mMyoMyo1_008881 [Myotis myotis]
MGRLSQCHPFSLSHWGSCGSSSGSFTPPALSGQMPPGPPLHHSSSCHLLAQTLTPHSAGHRLISLVPLRSYHPTLWCHVNLPKLSFCKYTSCSDASVAAGGPEGEVQNPILAPGPCEPFSTPPTSPWRNPSVHSPGCGAQRVPGRRPGPQHTPQPTPAECSVFTKFLGGGLLLTLLVCVGFAFYAIEVHVCITIFKRLEMFAFEWNRCVCPLYFILRRDKICASHHCPQHATHSWHIGGAQRLLSKRMKMEKGQEEERDGRKRQWKCQVHGS